MAMSHNQKQPHSGRAEAFAWQMPESRPTYHRPTTAVLGVWKESTKVNEAFGPGFPQYCARIVYFAMPHTVDGTRYCHNQTASHRPSGRTLTGTV
jgi:hypothetical protein